MTSHKRSIAMLGDAPSNSMTPDEFRAKMENVDIRRIKEEIMKYNKNVSMINGYSKMNKTQLIDEMYKYKDDFLYLLKLGPKPTVAKTEAIKPTAIKPTAIKPTTKSEPLMEFDESSVPEGIRDLEVFDIVAGYIDTVKKATRISQLKTLKEDMMDEVNDYDEADVKKVKKYITLFEKMLQQKIKKIESGPPTELPKFPKKQDVAPPAPIVSKPKEQGLYDMEFNELSRLLQRKPKEKTKIQGQFTRIVRYLRTQKLNKSDKERFNTLIRKYREK